MQQVCNEASNSILVEKQWSHSRMGSQVTKNTAIFRLIFWLHGNKWRCSNFKFLAVYCTKILFPLKHYNVGGNIGNGLNFVTCEQGFTPRHAPVLVYHRGGSCPRWSWRDSSVYRWCPGAQREGSPSGSTPADIHNWIKVKIHIEFKFDLNLFLEYSPQVGQKN